MADVVADLASGKPSRIAVTGSSGLVGAALVEFLRVGGHEVIEISRSSRVLGGAHLRWPDDDEEFATNDLEDLDSIVHLAGESIAQGRWTATKKKKILDSRVQGTGKLSRAIAALQKPPVVLVSASAIGFYGSRGEEVLTEESSVGRDFLADVCRCWEEATSQAKDAGVRVVNLRIGVVLSAAGGALAKVLLPFRLGAGGVIGNGRQFMSWISLDDLLGVVLHVINDTNLAGPVNAVSPLPVTNSEYTRTLGRVLGRPTLLPLPEFAARLALGEMADALLLSSTRVEPSRLVESGYRFQTPELEAALRHLLGPG